MLGRKKRNTEKIQETKKMKDITYPPKIILAWTKSLEGNVEITRWLLDNGYKELAMANQAIYLKNEARDWLMNNGYPQLMAMINAAEGKLQAQNWLKVHKFDKLYHMALAIDGERESWEWLGQHVPVDIFLLTKTIEKIKDSIEENHNDVHSFGKD
jgi:ribosomal protein S15P/S13E